MTIEIHTPRLESLIRHRLESGAFQSVEDVLLHALETSPDVAESGPTQPPRKNLAQFLMDSPLRGSGLKLERIKDYPRPIDL